MNNGHDLSVLIYLITTHLLILVLLHSVYLDSKKIEENTNKIEKLYTIVQTVCTEEVGKIEETSK